MTTFFSDFISTYSGDREAGQAFINYIKNRTTDSQATPVYELSEHAIFQVNNLIEGKLDRARQESSEILKKETD